MILSYFDIGDIFYNSCNKTTLLKLQKLQNTALHCIYKCNYETPTSELHTKANLFLASDRRCLNLSAMAHKRGIPHFKIDTARRSNLRSNAKSLLEINLSRNRTYDRCFIHKAAIVWNGLTEDLKAIPPDECKLFKICLKQEMKMNNINFPE